MLSHLRIPKQLNRNDINVSKVELEHTGQLLINLAKERCGISSLEDKDILDIGCGVRFTATIINRGIPIKSYTGLEVHKPIVDFLKQNVATLDSRFRYHHWNVHNEQFNPDSSDYMSNFESFPFAEKFDCLWLFSVFTHLTPEDSHAMLRILSEHVRPKGKLFFSAFIDDKVETFEDREKDNPLAHAYYGKKFMCSLIEEEGWKIDSMYERDPSKYIQHHFVCSLQ